MFFFFFLFLYCHKTSAASTEQQVVSGVQVYPTSCALFRGLLELHCPLQAAGNDRAAPAAAVILCILPVGSTYCCVTPSSAQAHSITHYLLHPALKTDAWTTSQSHNLFIIFSLFKPRGVMTGWVVSTHSSPQAPFFFLHCIIAICWWLSW